MQIEGPKINICDDFAEKLLSYSEETVTTSQVINVTEEENSNHVDDVSWYFEDSGGQSVDPNADLEKYRYLFSQSTDLSNGSEPLSCKLRDLKTSALKQNETPSKEHLSPSLNFDLLKEFDINKEHSVGNGCDDFDDCFTELHDTRNSVLQMNYKDVCSPHNTERSDSISDVEIDGDSDDDEFKDCFLETSTEHDAKTIEKSNFTNKTPELPKSCNKLSQSIKRLDAKLMKTSSSGRSYTSCIKNATQQVLDALGHPISYGVPLAPRKILNNSRHFKSIESVIEEHQDNDQQEEKHKDTLGHSISYGVPSAPRNLLTNSRHFMTAHQENDHIVHKDWSSGSQPTDASTEGKVHTSWKNVVNSLIGPYSQSGITLVHPYSRNKSDK